MRDKLEKRDLKTWLFNPFALVAGWNALLAGVLAILLAGYVGSLTNTHFDGVLDTHPKSGTWHVCLVPAEGNRDCISPTVTVQTAAEPCAPDSGGVQIVRIVFQQN